jgi:lipopolysaccharide transport system ATP-binding protein
MPAIIRAENLGKSYRIDQAGPRTRYRTLRESLAEAATAPIRRLWNEPAVGRATEFWALRGVELEVHQGEVVGIIGRNGAGKSTLLKILSRITRPTTGHIELRGRVGSLLEVGTGFHPELTGRENIYLNGSILGMGRREVAHKFDDIVAFAEVEKFLDTPVKRYSSGMYVRLAFAVAAHLEPDILIIDEVLAVGDAAFQERCLGKMGDVARSGRTVLFVSHNLAAVQALCTRSIFLSQGSVLLDGPNEQVIPTYLASLSEAQVIRIAERTDRGGTGSVRLSDIEVHDPAGIPEAPIATGRAVKFLFRLDRPLRDRQLIFALYNQYGQLVVDFDSRKTSSTDRRDLEPGDTIGCEIDEFTLVPGDYRMNVVVLHGAQMADHVEGAMTIKVQDGVLRGRPVPHGTRGTTAMAHRWQFS